MKKFLCVLTAAAMLGALAGCDQDYDGRETPDESMSITEMYRLPSDMDANDVMFEFRISNGGEVCSDENYWVNDTYDVYYDGRVEYTGIYNLGDPQCRQEYMSYEDVATVYATACQFMYSHDETVNDYNGCDANSYSFVFYDAHNVYHQLMVSDGARGQMGDIASIIYSYFPDEAPSPTPAPADESDVLELSDEWEMRLTLVYLGAADGTASTHDSYHVCSDATLEYTNTDLNGSTTIIDFEDLCLVEDFLRGVLSGEIENPQSHYAPNGILYNISYTGEDGVSHSIYLTGVLEGEALELYEMLSSYYS